MWRPGRATRALGAGSSKPASLSHFQAFNICDLLEVGYAPGLTDGGIREARDLLHPSFTAKRVQPGTYYVRVRGKNKCGDGAPSPELAVTVP